MEGVTGKRDGNMVRTYLLLSTLLASSVSGAPAEGALRAGAARVDITPPEGAALRMSGYAGRESGFEGIHDRLFIRAVVVDDGAQPGVVAIADLSAVSHGFWDELAGRIERELNIPRRNVLVAATHTHAGPSLGRDSDDRPDPKGEAYAREVQGKFVEAVRQARANLQPARVGAGEGSANVNVNRRARMANGALWLGRNPDGPSDKTVAVVKFESLSGAPIAVIMNYGVHCTVFGPKNLRISGDLAGAASRHVEQRLGGGAVAVFTSGAAGDQAPIYNRAESYDDVAKLGRILGDEVIRVSAKLRMSAVGRVAGSQATVTCPGQKRVAGSQKDPAGYRFEDAAPVTIRLSLLMINQVAITGVSGEVLTMIAQRLKKESPLSRTLMVTNCNGYNSYIPDDAAYDEVSYEIVSAPMKRGCAENAIVNGLLEMMDTAAARR